MVPIDQDIEILYVWQGICSALAMNTLSSKQAVSWLEGRRRRAWDLHQQGWSQPRIAAALGVTHSAVSQWLQRAATGGVDALRAHSAPGPGPRLTSAQLAQLPALLAAGAAAWGFRGPVWTRRVAQVIYEQFGVRYHPRHVGRLLAQLGWTVQKPIRQATQRDEAAIAAWLTQEWPALKKRPRGKDGPLSG